MRNAVILALGWACSLLAAPVNDTAKLADLGTSFNSANGQLAILLTGDYATWKNGRPVIPRPYPYCETSKKIFLRPGDSLVEGGPEGFSQYRLDYLSSNRAGFTIRRFAPFSPVTNHFRPGKMLSIESINVDLPIIIFDDSQPNFVELGQGPAARTK